MDGINRLNTAKAGISKLQDVTIKTIQIETEWKTDWGDKSIKELWDFK